MSNQNIKNTEILFERIKKLFPESSVSLNIHGVSLKDLPKEWDIKRFILPEGKPFFTATRNQEAFDITLYE